MSKNKKQKQPIVLMDNLLQNIQPLTCLRIFQIQ